MGCVCVCSVSMWFGLSVCVVRCLCPVCAQKCVCCMHVHVLGCDPGSSLSPSCHLCPSPRAEKGPGAQAGVLEAAQGDSNVKTVSGQRSPGGSAEICTVPGQGTRSREHSRAKYKQPWSQEAHSSHKDLQNMDPSLGSPPSQGWEHRMAQTPSLPMRHMTKPGHVTGFPTPAPLRAPTHLSKPCAGCPSPRGLPPSSRGLLSLLPTLITVRPMWSVITSVPPGWGEARTVWVLLQIPVPGAEPWAGSHGCLSDSFRHWLAV